jgi:hypothetical protein
MNGGHSGNSQLILAGRRAGSLLEAKLILAGRRAGSLLEADLTDLRIEKAELEADRLRVELRELRYLARYALEAWNDPTCSPDDWKQACDNLETALDKEK